MWRRRSSRRRRPAAGCSRGCGCWRSGRTRSRRRRCGTASTAAPSTMAGARETAGNDTALMIDAGWLVRRTPKEALEMVRRLEPYRPFWIEEALAPDDYDGYRYLAEHTETRIAAGEQEATLWGFDTLIHRAKLDVIQPDLSRCGGLSVAPE